MALPKMPSIKKKLTIRACKPGTLTAIEEPAFEVMLNPSSLKHDHSISYADRPTIGQAGAEPKFRSVGAETLTIDLMLDGTGVVYGLIPGVAPDVPSQVQRLKSIVYAYHTVYAKQSKRHETNVVYLVWGDFKFHGRLRTMGIKYTLFKPTGTPLRAEVNLVFVSFMTKLEEALRANRTSPDLSHRVEVKAGDTLPLLCYRIYGDSSYYVDVARHNGISGFRRLEPGTRLSFPPLRAS